MIRVVVDTNVIVSALLQPSGPPAQVLVLAIGRSIELCLSGNIYAEYDEVLRRAKFGFGNQTITAALESLRQNAFWARSLEPVKVCLDPNDDMFLECAAAAQADYLVTGNLRHFPHSWGKTRVVTPRALLDLIGNTSH